MFLLTAGFALAQKSKPIVIAHRGASGYLPEHTLAAKAMAHGLGADFLEQDIVLSKEYFYVLERSEVFSLLF